MKELEWTIKKEASRATLTEVYSEPSESQMREYILAKESGGNPVAQNPESTAFGRWQFLDGTWEIVGCEKTDDPVEQDRCFELYVVKVYGSIKVAYEHHVTKGWY